MKLTAEEIKAFLIELLNDGRLHLADIEILNAHASLEERTGTNSQIAEVANDGVVEVRSREYTHEQKEDNPLWNQALTWHTVDVLQRWLCHALAEKFPYYSALVRKREDGTRRWWMALGGADRIDAKVMASCLHQEIADALDNLKNI